MKTHSILRIGHRGAMGHLAENTLASIQKALELKCDMIEIDIHKIKSGELMVFHDTTLERLTNGKGAIEDTTFEELRKLKIEGQYTIPTLEEVIETIHQKAIINIELKGAHTAIACHNIVHSYLAKGWQTEDFIISSFRWDELEVISQQENPLPIAVLTAETPTKEVIDFALKIKAIAINPHYQSISLKSTKAIKKAGLKIYPWTVNSPSDIQRLKELKVDGIITNFPERV